MFERFLGLTTGASLTDLGILAALTTVVVEVLKQIVPKNFPTKFLTIIVSLFISFTSTFTCYGITVKNGFSGLIIGFITAFVAMNGFDSLKSIWDRFVIQEEDSEECEGEE